jgi:circadian clock protein KaiB
MKKEKKSIDQFAKAVAERDRAKHVLQLYVAGMTTKSIDAITNVRKLCEKYLTGRYELMVIDIYQQPGLAKEEQIIATPTLIKRFPLPLRKLIGNMADTERFLVGLGLQPPKLMSANE